MAPSQAGDLGCKGQFTFTPHFPHTFQPCPPLPPPPPHTHTCVTRQRGPPRAAPEGESAVGFRSKTEPAREGSSWVAVGIRITYEVGGLFYFCGNFKMEMKITGLMMGMGTA